MIYMIHIFFICKLIRFVKENLISNWKSSPDLIDIILYYDIRSEKLYKFYFCEINQNKYLFFKCDFHSYSIIYINNIY